MLWCVNALISFVFPQLVAAAGATVTFGLFVLINIGSIGFVAKFVPETRGRTLEELEDEFRTHDAAHLVDPAWSACTARNRLDHHASGQRPPQESGGEGRHRRAGRCRPLIRV